MNRLDGRIDPARIAGPGAAAGDSLEWDGARPVWAPGGGGGLFGYTELELSYGTQTSDDTGRAATSVTAVRVLGQPGVGASNADGTLDYCNDDFPSLYIVNARIDIAPLTNAASTDVHMVSVAEVFWSQVQTFIGTGAVRLHFTGLSVLTPSTYNGPVAPQITITCTGGTNRTYSATSATWHIARFRSALVTY